MPNSMKLLTTWRFRRPFTERRSRDGLPILPKVTAGTVHTGGRRALCMRRWHVVDRRSPGQFRRNVVEQLLLF